MRHTVQVELLERLLALGKRAPEEVVQSRVSVKPYRDPEQAENERRVLFGALPLCVAHVSEVARPGDFVTRQIADTAILLVRDKQGQVRAFVNVCRHRGAPLAHHKEGSGCKAFVCMYHGWVYDLQGTLMHVPGEQFFPDLDRNALGLVPLPVACAHGFVWVVPGPRAAADDRRDDRSNELAIGPYLDAIDDDLTHFGLHSHVLYRKSERVLACNWKLVIDAFLEGYHLETLHRHSLYRFFGHDGVIFDFFEGHVRSIGARKNIRDETDKPREAWDIRACTTPFYLLFPNTIVVVHPDYVSVLTVEPMSVDRSYCTHYMLVPEMPGTEKQKDRYDRSFELIDGTVFEKEDMAAAESVQRGLGSRAYEHFVLGHLEYPIRVFHDRIAVLLDSSS